jgi:hypothetical protein
MTILLQDSKHELVNGMGVELRNNSLVSELVYADDTMLMDVDANALQSFMDCIAKVGREYGLQLNFSKVEAMPVRTEASLRQPDGIAVKTKAQIQYLGCTLSNDGRHTSDLGRRLGLAMADFESLRRVWSHSSLRIKRKLQIFQACVVTRLLYGMTASWPNKAERRRLDGFQARCLRRILKIQHSYYSRISNETVRQRACVRPLTNMLLQQQLLYFGTLAKRPDGDPVRECVLVDGSIAPRPLCEIRRRGRPRLEWAVEVHKHGVKVASGCSNLSEMMDRSTISSSTWKMAVWKDVDRL